MGYAIETRKTTVAAAVTDACADLIGLGEEMREIVDNAPESLQQSDAMQTREQTADVLESITEPDVPENCGHLEVTYKVSVQKRKGRGESRAIRCSNACAMLQAAVEVMEGHKTDLEADREEEMTRMEKLQIEALGALIEETQGILDEAESLEFPGMYG